MVFTQKFYNYSKELGQFIFKGFHHCLSIFISSLLLAFWDSWFTQRSDSNWRWHNILCSTSFAIGKGGIQKLWDLDILGGL